MINGPFFLDLDSENINNIKSPFLMTILTTGNYGFYGIRKIQHKKDSSTFYDVWILTTDNKSQSRLDSLSKDSSIKCCYTDDIYTVMNGFIRYIKYQMENDKVSDMVALYEGQIT